MNNTKAKKISYSKWATVIFLAVPGITLLMTYGKWELLTLLHGKEFDVSDFSGDSSVVREKTRIGNPQFIKVINYSQDEAEVLHAMGAQKSPKPLPSDNREYQYMYIYKRSKAPQANKWIFDTMYSCTPAHGPPDYYFPFYGGFPDFRN